MNLFLPRLMGTLVVRMVLPLLSDPLNADPAPSAEEAKTICSKSGSFCVVSDPKKNETAGFRVASSNAVRLWQTKGFFPIGALSDDGEHFVAGYEGGHRLPLDYAKDAILLRFFRHGTLVRSVKLSELVRDLSKLKRIGSQYYWGDYLGFNQEGRYVVRTVEKRIVVFDVSTGNQM